MRNLTLKSRILVWIAVVNLAVFLVAGAVILMNARVAVRTEVLAAQGSAVDLIRANLNRDQRLLTEVDFSAKFAATAQPRHVRIVLPEARFPAPQAHQADEAAPPGWFLRWIEADIQPVEIRAPRAGGGENRLIIQAVSDDEAAEVWEDARALFLVWGAAGVLQLALLSALIGRALRPVAQLSRSLEAIAVGNLTARAGPVASADLGSIARQIDALAQSLADERASRLQMTRRFQELRDSERREIARDLHDELGPCLFGLSVAADALSQQGAPDQQGQAATILRHVASIREINQRILDAVRPVALGKLPLPDVIRDLVGDLEDLHSDVTIDCDLPADLPATDDSVALSLYRAIQEGVTNALRHGRASQVRIRLSRCLHERREAIRLELTDNGQGLGKGWRHGNGLMGMLERAVAVGGLFTIRDAGGGGVELSLLLPVEAP